MESLSGLQERILECSGQRVLECGCGEKLILLGLEEDWRSELAPPAFECRCGQDLKLDATEAGPSEEVLEIVKLLRSSTRSPESYIDYR